MSGRANMRDALRAYVLGHDRVWTRHSKMGETEDATGEVEFGRVPDAPRFGVPVPERFDFSRGPAAQRDRFQDASASTND